MFIAAVTAVSQAEIPVGCARTSILKGRLILCRIKSKGLYMNHLLALVAQLEERPLREWEVADSSPGRDIPKSLKMVSAAPHLAHRLTG